MKIFLIGFMGVGKTTIGKRLAHHLQLPFIDLDTYISTQHGKSVADIFNDSGEEYFRTLEQNSLQQVMQQEKFVLACGGGTACYFDNMAQMNRAGITIYIEAVFPFIFSRILQSRANRPLVSNIPESSRRASLEALFAKRKPFYEQAQLQVNVEKLAPAEALRLIVQKMQEANLL